jgi:ATP-dependent Clp protease ATP-binding subunit ClpB
MNLEKFTERARGFLQSAQTVATRMNHQRIAPAHVLKALLAAQDPGSFGRRRERRPRARRRDHPPARPGRADRAESGR